MNFLKGTAGSLGRKTWPARTTGKLLTKKKMEEQAAQNPTFTFHRPQLQPFYGFKDGNWQVSKGNEIPTYTTLPTIKLISWNIDSQTFAALARMNRAVSYLHDLISNLPPDTPSIICLQEMTSSDLDVLRHAEWIRKGFQVTDVSSQDWQARYGTVMLVDRRLRITSVFRVRYASAMGRDALFVDIEDMAPRTLRFCNTHLESLEVKPPLRPAQVKLAVRYLKDPAADGGVIAGDFNAIEEFDKTLHIDYGLKDAYLEEGGVEGHADGWTWGMQNRPKLRQRSGCKRLDKMLYCGTVKVQNLERIGADVKIDGPGGGKYVTDHLGLMGDVLVTAEDL